MNETTGPVAAGERIGALDSLRGFALLGILVINIQMFAMPSSAIENPVSYGNLEGANFVVWFLSYVFFNQKMMNLFSLLFGVGIVLFAERQTQAGRSPVWIHYRRMGILLGVGLIHAYGFWFGDILVTYALCGFVLYLALRLSPKWLLILGVISLALSSGAMLLFGFLITIAPEEVRNDILRESFYPDGEILERELAMFRGSWIEQTPYRIQYALIVQVFFNFILLGIFRPLGMMLLGMALYKQGFFSGALSVKTLAIRSAVLLLIGYSIVVYGVYDNVSSGWDGINYFLDGAQYNYWGAILVSLGYAHAMMAIVSYGCLPGVQRVFANVGRMAFTNYLAQTLICTLIFYGYGLGWFGHVERVGQISVVLLVWALILVWSPLWLRAFRFGPLEWVWRCLTYGKVFAIRR